MLYDPPTRGILPQVVLAGLSWAAVGFGIWRFRKQSPLLLFAALTFAFLLLPVLNFFKITTLMNDRYLYLPCIAVFAVVASALQRLLSVNVHPVSELVRPFVSGLKWSTALAATAAYLVMTSQHLPVWQNSQSLWNHTMQHVPQLPVVRMQLALTHYDNGQQREAIRILQQALVECQPDDLDRERMQSAVSEWSAELDARTVANQLRTF
ncbi:MAG: hypothetical protein R3C19_22425 [Planctomycetaceae bacterium]